MSASLPITRSAQPLPRRRVLRYAVMASASIGVGYTIGAAIAQTVDSRQWQGATAMTRQPEQVVANSMAEWRSLWSRVGMNPPDVFEPGRMSAIGIFLGVRQGDGYSVNVVSTTRRRDRVIVVFEERAPADVMMAQRMPPAPPAPQALTTRPVASFASPGATSSLAPPPARPIGPPTSPWAIVLINRGDLPVIVEQRWFR